MRSARCQRRVRLVSLSSRMRSTRASRISGTRLALEQKGDRSYYAFDEDLGSLVVEAGGARR